MLNCLDSKPALIHGIFLSSMFRWTIPSIKQRNNKSKGHNFVKINGLIFNCKMHIMFVKTQQLLNTYDTCFQHLLSNICVSPLQRGGYHTEINTMIEKE